jgi:hypothetical protein
MLEFITSFFPASDVLKQFRPEDRLMGLRPDERLMGLKRAYPMDGDGGSKNQYQTYVQKKCRGEPCVRPPNNNRLRTYVRGTGSDNKE